jgi:hypothetical protein
MKLPWRWASTLAVIAAVGASPAGAQLSPYVTWERAVRAECDKHASGRQIDDMSACAQRMIDQALKDGFLTEQDVERCMARSREGPRGRGSPALAAWSACGLRNSVARALAPPPAPAPAAPAHVDSQFSEGKVEAVRVRALGTQGPALATRPWQRADIVPPLYAGRFTLLPNRGLDNMRYYSQTVHELKRLCPEVGNVPDFTEALPYAIENFNDTLKRAGRGDVSPTETAQIILAVGHMLTSGADNCDTVPDHEYDACLARKDPKSSVLPSLDAVADVRHLVQAHGCASPQLRRYAGNLAGYFRKLRLDGGSSAGLPAPDTPVGAAYLRVFDQCARQAGGGSADRWCGCQVRRLHDRHGDSPTNLEPLEALARDPWVDFRFRQLDNRTILPESHFESRAGLSYPRLPSIGPCAEESSAIRFWRQDTAPRTTACLVSESPATPSRCTYETAWGRFSVTAAPRCPLVIDSRIWGGEELQCKPGMPAAAVAPSQIGADGVRRHRRCGTGMPCVTVLTYERAVAPGFMPSPVTFSPAELPAEIHLPEQKAAGSLFSITVGATESSLQGYVSDLTRGRPEAERRAFFMDVYRLVTEDKSLLLECRYRGDGARFFWYRSVPERVVRRDLSLDVAYHPLLQLGAAQAWCPPSAGPALVLSAPAEPVPPRRPTQQERRDEARQQKKDDQRCAYLTRQVENAQEAAARRPNAATERRLGAMQQKLEESGCAQ